MGDVERGGAAGGEVWGYWGDGEDGDEEEVFGVRVRVGRFRTDWLLLPLTR